MMVAAERAIKLGLNVEEADTIISTVFGAPKTGIFGLLDLVGLDLMPHVMSSMTEHLDKNDEYNLYSKPPEIFDYMLENKLIGRKGIGGFYKLENVNGKKVKTSINLIFTLLIELKLEENLRVQRCYFHVSYKHLTLTTICSV